MGKDLNPQNVIKREDLPFYEPYINDLEGEINNLSSIEDPSAAFSSLTNIANIFNFLTNIRPDNYDQYKERILSLYEKFYDKYIKSDTKYLLDKIDDKDDKKYEELEKNFLDVYNKFANPSEPDHKINAASSKAYNSNPKKGERL